MKIRFDRLLDLYSKYMVVWVVALSAWAYFKPVSFTSLKPYMNGFFALTMFGIGVTLHVEDFKRILENPKIIAIGSLAQFTIMPFSAFLIARAMNLPPAITVGLILTGAAPGAMASNVLSYIARADAAYSVSLTAVSTFLTPILTPFLVYILAKSVLEVNFWEIFFSLIQMVVIPLALGIMLRHFFSKFVEKVMGIFPAISVTFIAFICALVIALNRSRLSEITMMVLAAVIILNVNGMVLGYGVGKVVKLNLKRRRTLSIEIGMQNAGLGTVLALRHFSAETAIPAAAFVFICIFTASIMAEKWRSSKQEET